MIAWLLELQAKARRWWMWNSDEAIVISSRSNRTWLVYVETQPVCGTDDPPTEHIAAYEINRRTGEKLLDEPERYEKPERTIFTVPEPDTFQKDFEQGRIEPRIDPDDRGYAA